MRVRGGFIVWLLLGPCLLGSQTPVSPPSVLQWLDRYAAGEFERVASELAGDVEYDDILKQLRRDAPGWVDAAAIDLVSGRSLNPRERRELVAATFALEAARAGLSHQWKRIQRQPQMTVPEVAGAYQPPSLLYWDAPPLLIEWACERMRSQVPRHPLERWWQLAALSVAQRSEDPQFLIGDTNLGRGLGSEEIGNTSDEIKHLDHVTPRFPDEMRFVLAQGVARDRVWPGDAERVYRALERHPDVGGEALMRLGAMQMRQRDAAGALKSLERAEAVTRDPYVVFLARYFKGQLFEQQRRDDRAEAAYRGAVAAVPHAQSATLALAALVFRDGRRSEAQRLVQGMLAARPRPGDPWRGFVRADDRFWPQLVGRLREEILR